MVTEARLSPAAAAAVHALLDPGESLADASVWADAEAQRDRRTPKAWHYVDVPIGLPTYDPHFCRKRGCVVSKVEELSERLRDPTLSRAEQQTALRLLVHLVEDLHQPLHVGDHGDRGGNDFFVRFFRAKKNLHQLWDVGILEHAGQDEAALAHRLEELATPSACLAWSHGSPETWATESLRLAQQAYRDPETQRPLVTGAALGIAYFQFALPHARERLAQAAVRLAEVLDEIFAHRPAP